MLISLSQLYLLSMLSLFINLFFRYLSLYTYARNYVLNKFLTKSSLKICKCTNDRCIFFKYFQQTSKQVPQGMLAGLQQISDELCQNFSCKVYANVKMTE